MELKSNSPATLKLIGSVRTTAPEEVPDYVSRAREAQRRWGSVPLEKRLRILPELRRALQAERDDVARLVSLEAGKPFVEAFTVELLPSLDMLKFLEHHAARVLGPERIGLGWFVHKRSVLEYLPLGVVGIISPWNFPFGIPFTSVVSALVAGNAVLLKPSELTPLTGERLAEVFRRAGLDPDLLQVLQGDGATGAALVAADIDKVLFTGSVATGKRVMAEAARTLKPVTLELGGKDPMLVFKDADLDRAANGAVWGAFTNAGQVCASVERCYVERAAASEFIELVVAKTRALRQGIPVERLATGELAVRQVDVGAMIGEAQLEKVHEQVLEASRLGGELLCGGAPRRDLPGYFYQPTVLRDVPPEAKLMQEETFGPVLPITLVDSVEEAVKLANSSRYALSASVWSRDRSKARTAARRLEAGTVWINDVIYTYGLAATPWGGFKESGIGRTHAALGLREFCHVRHLNEGYYPVKTELQWYPYSEKRLKWLKRLANFLYS